jgi:S-adenosylmethionine hydrolase
MLITLTTDFGETDGYAAAMKGIILGINPEADIVDITHNISPHDIRQAAFILSTAFPFFPEGTIHLVVVDPGVGTGRKPIILCSGSSYFVAPDNGVLSYVVDDIHGKAAIRSFVISNPLYRRPALSRTFHGRDIFAPAAAYLSLGISPDKFGEPLSSLNTFPVPLPERKEDGSLTGEVIYVDSFGNLVTNIKETDISEGEITVEVAGRRIAGLSRSYQESKGFLAIINSSGRLEIALQEGSAANLLKAKTGIKISVLKGGNRS